MLAMLSFMVTHCAEAPRREAHSSAPPKPSSSAPLQPISTLPEPAASANPSPSSAAAEPPSGDPLKAPLNVDTVLEEAAARPAPTASAAAVPEEPIVIGRYSFASVAGIPDTRGIIFSLMPAFRTCYQRAHQQSNALRGAFRLSIDITPSGKVSNLSFPVSSSRRTPMFDGDGSAGAPRPNPNNQQLQVVLLPCMKARIRAARFSAFDRPYWVTFDFKIQ